MPSWFFGLAQDYFILGMGIMGLQGDSLARFRALVDRDGDALAGAISQAAERAGASISDWGPEPLKRVPKPYAQDHPHGDLLRRKALAVSAPMPEDWRSLGLVKATGERVQALLPVYRVLAGFG